MDISAERCSDVRNWAEYSDYRGVKQTVLDIWVLISLYMSFSAGIYQQYFTKILQGKPMTIWQLKGGKTSKTKQAQATFPQILFFCLEFMHPRPWGCSHSTVCSAISWACTGFAIPSPQRVFWSFLLPHPFKIHLRCLFLLVNRFYFWNLRG